MTRPTKEELARSERRITRCLFAVAVLIAGFLLYATVVSVPMPREDRFDDTLPNPMGGPARTAPGEASGEVALGGLQVAGAEVPCKGTVLVLFCRL